MKFRVYPSNGDLASYAPQNILTLNVPYLISSDEADVAVSFTDVAHGLPADGRIASAQKPLLWLPEKIMDILGLEAGDKVRAPQLKNVVTCSFLINVDVPQEFLNLETVEQHQVVSFQTVCMNNINLPRFCHRSGLTFSQTITFNGENVNVLVRIQPMAEIPDVEVYTRKSWLNPVNGMDTWDFYSSDLKPNWIKSSFLWGTVEPDPSTPKSAWYLWHSYSKSLPPYREDEITSKVKSFLGLNPKFVFVQKPEQYIRN